ncbi:MAG: hypothetical protein CMP56_05045 [Flavobacteriales bacterium]|nr:hypothetical protein [Flavobacteriales bacterium]
MLGLFFVLYLEYMILRILFLCVFSVCFSQNNTILESLESNYSFELNNIGDPLIFLIPKPSSTSLFLNHVSKDIRNIDFQSKKSFLVSDTIYSQISYTGAYKYGGLLETFLTRPIGQYVKLNFAYDNLSSEGFFNHQHNKYGNILLSLDFKKDDFYSCSFLFGLLGAKYEQSGGLVSYNQDISADLNPTYLTSASTELKRKKIKFSQTYLFDSGLKLKHDVSALLFKRDFVDLSPLSFYYSFTNSEMVFDNYHLNIFFNSFFNTLSFSKNKFNFSINHNYYHTNDLSVDKIGDIIFSFNSTDVFKKQKNIYFNLVFCPLGYNKNNYLLDLRWEKNTLNFSHFFSFDILSKKPDFFRQHYVNNLSWDWSSFSPSTTLSLKFKSALKKRHLFASFFINRSSHFLYFNEFASPIQLEDNLLYLNFRLNKTWHIGNLFFNTAFCFQYADNEVLSIPMFFYHKEIKYTYGLSNGFVLSSSLNSYFFSKYYADSFFPLTDVFYQQRTQESVIQPFFSGNLLISKKDFSCGIIFNNLQNLFLSDSYFLPDYILPQPIVRFSIKWGFLD